MGQASEAKSMETANMRAGRQYVIAPPPAHITRQQSSLMGTGNDRQAKRLER
jgi:hypothetical protein